MPVAKKRLRNGDRPTEKLHNGSNVCSLANHLRLQDDYDCYLKRND